MAHHCDSQITVLLSPLMLLRNIPDEFSAVCGAEMILSDLLELGI